MSKRDEPRLKSSSLRRQIDNDPQIKAMRHLMAVQSDPAKINEIQVFIDKRIAELSGQQSPKQE
jgi:hypothetical protein